MVHEVVDLGSVLGTEPGFLGRVGLVKPPGHGYVRYLLYDLSQPTSPMVAVWFNPLVGEEKRYIKGDAVGAQMRGCNTDPRKFMHSPSRNRYCRYF
jgi:hypothetical protein